MNLIANLMVLLGASLVTTGAALWEPAAGFVVAGSCLVVWGLYFVDVGEE